jgi:hypothetical protein
LARSFLQIAVAAPASRGMTAVRKASGLRYQRLMMSINDRMNE